MKNKHNTKILLTGIIVSIILILGLFYQIYNLSKKPGLQKISNTPLSCSASTLKCTWNVVPGAAQYEYKFKDKTTGEVLPGESGSGTISASAGQSNITVTYITAPIPGKAYTCEVVAITADAQNCRSDTGTSEIKCGSTTLSLPKSAPANP